ncbi:MAG: hypothetical protein M3020_06780, partial [Myxococcota bacterium]|nr:hypothetical protein [Myxococcota bacterium]
LSILRFFDGAYLPSWPVLARSDGIEITTQAEVIADALMDGTSDVTIGPRQRSMLAAIIALAIEFKLPVVSLPWLLSVPSEVTTLASRSSVPSVRLGLGRFERERPDSIDGLIARLSTILRSSLKAVLSGDEPFDFTRCFIPGSITILDFGGAPLGALPAVRAMGSLAVSGVANAAFDPRRKLGSKTLLVLDEPQVFATSVSVASIQRLLETGRSFGAGALMLAHQGVPQLPQSLQLALGTNVVLRALGRSAEADAAAASEWLPVTRVVPRPAEPGTRSERTRFLSESEERRFRIAEIGRLPTRHFLVADRRIGAQPRVIRSAEYAPPEWDAIDPEIADAVRRGSNGVPRVELEARVHEIEETAAARFEESLRTEQRGGRKRGRVIETPDVVGRDDEGARGGVP